jgi:membrane protease YdiL (CAAX protease family)
MTDHLDNRPWSIGQAAGALFVGFAAAVIASLIVGPELTDRETFRVVVPAQGLAQVAIIGWWASQSARRRLSLGLRFDSSDLIGLPIGVGFQIAASIALLPIVYWVFDGDGPTQEVIESASALSGVDIALMAVGVGVLAPIAEELVFRGALLRALIVRRGESFATYVSASVFAAIHLLDPNAWLVVPVLFLLGIVLAKQATSTGRLARPILTHAAFNLLAVGALLVGE